MGGGPSGYRLRLVQLWGRKTFGDAGLPAAYDLSFGYRLNDTNLRFTDEDTSFSRKTGLKVLVGYPDAPEDGQARLLITKRTGSRMVTVDENWQLEPGVTGHLFELKAEEWAAGSTSARLRSTVSWWRASLLRLRSALYG
ncbi:hypothetical protein N6H14_08610 [Paenibacillus sp. CC-CFT747]|nr:hypothetical protein N6H14_08610 [Paenibacillus sp. CC-CFT747]